LPKNNYDVIPNNGEIRLFKVTSYNIYETGALDEWKEVVIEENADVMLLQETGGWTDVNDLELQNNINYINTQLVELGESPYSNIQLTDEGGTTTGGAMILSKFNIVNFNQIYEYSLDNGDSEVFGHDLLVATVDIYGVEMAIITVHLNCCKDGDLPRQRDMEALNNYMDSLGSIPIILTGDFNSFAPSDIGEIAPNVPDLGYEPLSMLLNSSHPKSTQIHNWVDTFRELNPRDPGYTYVDFYYQSRIDYIFVNDYFMQSQNILVNSTVAFAPSSEIGSDHFPVSTTFNLDYSIDLRQPHRVYGVGGNVVNETTINLSWDANSDEDIETYSIYKDGELVAVSSNDTLSFTDNTLVSNTLYFYEISATDLNGNIGLKSLKQYVNTSYGMITKPHAPTLTSEALTGKIRLTWEVIDNGGLPILYFILYRTTETARERGLFPPYEIVENNYFDDINPRSGRTYFYKIVAYNEVDASPFSEEISVTALEVSSNSIDETSIPSVSILITCLLILLPIRKRMNKVFKST